MDKYIVLLLLISLGTSCKEVSTTDPYNFTVISIDSLERIGAEQFLNAPESAIRAYEEISSRSRKINNHEKSGAANLSIAKIYAEQLNNYDSAISYCNESLKDWEAKDNASEIAKVSNYLGYLQGLSGNHSAAEGNINKAISLYEGLGDLKGTAMAKLNMAKIKYQQSDFAAGLKYYKSSKQFWLKDGDQEKIFENNLVGIDLYKELGEDKLAAKLTKDNIQIARAANIPKVLMDKFEQQVGVEDK